MSGQITFQKTFGGPEHDFGNSFQQTSDGGYILFGPTASFGSGGWDMYLIKTNFLGNTVWTKTFGNENYEVANSVQQTTDGGFILCGASSAFGIDSLALIRTDSKGNEKWNMKYRGSLFRDVGRCVQQTSDGGFIAVGFNGDSFIEDVFLLKTNADGIVEWKKTYGGIGRDYGVSIKQTADGGYVVAGQTNSRGFGGDDMFLLRMNSLGDTLWTKTFGTIEFEIAQSVDITSDGGFILLGHEFTLDADLYLVKTDTEGNEEWNRYYGGAGRDIGYAVQETSDRGFILAGRKENDITDTEDMYCVKTNASGDVQWESIFPKGLFSDAAAVQETSDNGFARLGSVTFRVDENTFNSDFYLVKVDSKGKLEEVDNSESGIIIKVSANPFTEFTTLVFENPDHINYSLSLFDTQSKMIRQYNNLVNGELRIERENLRPGLYIFQLESGKKIVGTGKLIVE